MKRIKKLLAVMLAAIMVMSMGTSVFADTTSIAIKNVATDGHTFKAYQVFDGDVSNTTMSNVTWGTGIDSSSLLTAIGNLTSADTLYSYFYGKNITASSTASDVAKIVETNNSDTAFVTAFAAFVKNYINTTATGTSKAGQLQTDGTYTYTISDLDPGYYLVLDSTIGTESDAVSKYMLRVLSGETNEIDTKSVVPTVSKTVTDSDGNETTAISASAGDTVSFTLTGSVPSDVALYYTSYSYKFVDTLSSNLTYVTDSISVKTYNDKDCTTGETELGTTSSDGAYYTLDTTSGITVTINNALSLAGKYIVVKYNATVGDGITAGTAETNKVYVEYTNDSNTGDTGKTTEDTVYIYTFDLNVDKTDGSNVALAGASFSLYKKVTITDLNGGTYYTISGTSATQATNYSSSETYYILVKDKVEASSNSGNYTAIFNDLDEGTYALVESVTPAGYNTANAVTFTIDATYSDDGSSITALSTGNSAVSATSPFSTISTTIQNLSGASMPVTGGIGTTIFYIVGTLLVLGAAIVLVTRRRMAR